MALFAVGKYKHKISYDFYTVAASRGAWGTFALPQLEVLPPPHFPPRQKKKLSKSAIFGKLLDFFPSESYFAPSMPPTKNSGATTASTKSKLCFFFRKCSSWDNKNTRTPVPEL